MNCRSTKKIPDTKKTKHETQTNYRNVNVTPLEWLTTIIQQPSAKSVYQQNNINLTSTKRTERGCSCRTKDGLAFISLQLHSAKWRAHRDYRSPSSARKRIYLDVCLSKARTHIMDVPAAYDYIQCTQSRNTDLAKDLKWMFRRKS